MSRIDPSDSADHVAVELHDRVISRLHEAGLTLAGLLGLVAIDGYVVEQLVNVIDELDAVARDLRNAARPDPTRTGRTGSALLDLSSEPPRYYERTDERP